MSKTLKNKGGSVEKELKVWGKGPLNLMGTELDCYILTDGTPVFNKGKMMKAIGRQWKGASRTDMPNFIGAVNLQPFIRPELEEMLKGVEFYDGGRLISGYHSDILALVCNVYLEARQAGKLTASQQPIAQTCEMLIRSFAKVGIRALIYEQLGFEKFKHPEAFRILIESYLSEEIRKWSKEFPVAINSYRELTKPQIILLLKEAVQNIQDQEYNLMNPLGEPLMKTMARVLASKNNKTSKK